MSGACAHCGDRRLVAVRIPGHDGIEAVLCLTCSAVQAPQVIEAAGRPGGQRWPPGDPPAGR